MEDKQLKLLEDRINNAIAFIENLKVREKTLREEKEEFEKKVADLQDTINEKDQQIATLKENQMFLKNKIEVILDKLESLASLDVGGAYGEEESLPLSEEIRIDVNKEEEKEEKETEEALKVGGDESEIIVEENIVDLKNEEKENKSNENLLFDSEEPDRETAENAEIGEDRNDSNSGDDKNNPSVEP